MSSQFNVLDMAQDYADNNEIDVSDIFNSPDPVEKSIDDTPVDDTLIEKEKAPEKKEKKAWKPDISDMPEMNQAPITYSKDEYVEKRDTQLKNIMDDDAQQEALDAQSQIERQYTNIEAAKKRHGIIKLQIPPGPLYVAMMSAAIDTNYQRGQKHLDDVFNELFKEHPEFVLEWAPGYGPDAKTNEAPITDETQKTVTQASETVETTAKVPLEITKTPVEDVDTTTINIDKTNLPQISWSAEEVEKIKRSRTVNLNIIEHENLEFTEIKDLNTNDIDAVLSQYQRKTSDIVAALPASKYRATFTGLSYTEVIDLNASVEMNSLDSERKKWSIAFNHIHNQSIGPWEEYQWYIDPNTKKKVRIAYTATLPVSLSNVELHVVTKFDDFLMKTSFMDLDFILWKILCATSMSKEIITIDCHHVGKNGQECGNTYDWIYSPEELLMMDSVNPQVAEEMKETGTASTKDEITRVYNSSMLRTNSAVKLPHRGFQVAFGHISAYEYLNNVFGKIKELEDEDENDPTIASKGINYTTLSVIKSFIIEYPDGTIGKISGPDNILKVLTSLDEVDWLVIAEIVRMVLEPYQFRWALRDIVCPKCKNRSNIAINDMSRLLFIVARSLESVQVTLSRM